MSLIISLLVLTLVSQCWSAPQRRNWTPQAILYLKGAQGHRSALQRSSREEGDASQRMTPQRSSAGPGLVWSPVLLELLQRDAEEGGENPDDSSDEQQLNLTYF